MIILYFLIALVLVIYYVISPSDLIPDSYGLIGYLDDFSLVCTLIYYVMNRFYGRFRDRVEAEYRNILSE